MTQYFFFKEGKGRERARKGGGGNPAKVFRIIASEVRLGSLTEGEKSGQVPFCTVSEFSFSTGFWKGPLWRCQIRGTYNCLPPANMSPLRKFSKIVLWGSHGACARLVRVRVLAVCGCPCMAGPWTPGLASMSRQVETRQCGREFGLPSKQKIPSNTRALPH